MTWLSDADFIAKNAEPKCFECHHYERKFELAETAHRCHIAMPNFPRIGNHSKAYLYEPGAYRLEAYHV